MPTAGTAAGPAAAVHQLLRPMLLLLPMLLSPLATLTAAAGAPRRVVGAELLGTYQIPRGTAIPGAIAEVGGLSGLASDPGAAGRVYAVSDRGDVFITSVAVTATDGLQVELDGAFHVGVSGGNPSRPLYVDAEGIAVCAVAGGGSSELEAAAAAAVPLLVSTEDPPRVARLNKVNGTAWSDDDVALPPVQLGHIINASSTRRNGQLESLSCWTGEGAAAAAGAAAQAAASSHYTGTIFTANELSLHQDSEPPELWEGGTIGGSVRIFSVDRSTGLVSRTTRYVLDRRSGNGLVDVEAVGPRGSLLTMERAFEFGVGNTIKIYAVDSVESVPDASGCDSFSEASGCATAVNKRLVLDLGTVEGLELDNYEGMALLQEPLPDGRRVLLIVNDNNFSPGQLPTTFVALALTEEVTVALGDDLGVGIAPYGMVIFL
jgi:hypothetical protein